MKPVAFLAPWGLQGGQIWAGTALWQSLLAGQAWELSAKTAEGREEAAPARDLFQLLRVVQGIGNGHDAPQIHAPAPHCLLHSLPLLPSRGTGCGLHQGMG